MKYLILLLTFCCVSSANLFAVDGISVTAPYEEPSLLDLIPEPDEKMGIEPKTTLKGVELMQTGITLIKTSFEIEKMMNSEFKRFHRKARAKTKLRIAKGFSLNRYANTGATVALWLAFAGALCFLIGWLFTLGSGSFFRGGTSYHVYFWCHLSLGSIAVVVCWDLGISTFYGVPLRVGLSAKSFLRCATKRISLRSLTHPQPEFGSRFERFFLRKK